VCFFQFPKAYDLKISLVFPKNYRMSKMKILRYTITSKGKENKTSNEKNFFLLASHTLYSLQISPKKTLIFLTSISSSLSDGRGGAIVPPEPPIRGRKRERRERKAIALRQVSPLKQKGCRCI
jgi:hypothetical protein